MTFLRMLISFVLTRSSVYAAPGHREFSDEAAISLLRTGNVEVTNVVVETLMQTSWPSSQPNQYDHIRDLRRQVATTAKCKKAGGPCTKLDCCSTFTCDPLASTCAKPPKTTKSKSTKTTKTSTKSRKTDTTTTASLPTTTLTTSAIVTTTPVVSSSSSICVNPPEGIQCFQQGCCPGYTCVADYSAHSTAGYCSPTGLPTSATQPATSSTTVSAIVTTPTQAVSTSKVATCNTDPAVDCYSRGCCAGYSCVANYHASSTAGSCSLTSFPSSTVTSDVVRLLHPQPRQPLLLRPLKLSQLPQPRRALPIPLLTAISGGVVLATVVQQTTTQVQLQDRVHLPVSRRRLRHLM